MSLMWQVFGPNPQSSCGQQQYVCNVSPASIALFCSFCFSFCGVISCVTQFVSSCFMLRGFLHTCLICLPVIVLPTPFLIAYLILVTYPSSSFLPSLASLQHPLHSQFAVSLVVWRLLFRFRFGPTLDSRLTSNWSNVSEGILNCYYLCQLQVHGKLECNALIV